MNLELIGALTELEKERGISKDILIEAIEVAIVSAYKRNYGANSPTSVRVDFDAETGDIHVFSRKVVTEDVEDENTEISLEEAREIDPNYQVGDIVEEEVTPRDFGRIAAQTAKQVVIQRIREAERSVIFNEYVNRAGDVVNGIVNRVDNRNVVVDLGKVEAVLPASEQIPGEVYTPNSRFKFYISEVKQSTKGPQIFLSRTHPNLLKSIFELEVPEIQSGIVEIKSVAREAGQRSKIAVYSRDEKVDPVGACVGTRGMRVQAVVSQLNGEKIDVVQWVPEPEEFVANALSPAKTSYVRLDEAGKIARTVVPDDQLSLAIGKEGQNARLAARLTGWKIDIKSESQAALDPLFQPVEEEEGEELEGPVVAELGQDLASAPEDSSEDTLIDEELIEDAAEEVAETDAEEIDAELASSEVSPEDESTDAKEKTKEEPKGEQPSKNDSGKANIDVSSLSNVIKRKSWEERFGNIGIAEVHSAKESTKQEQGKEKRKKKREETVIKDFSQLDPGIFGFEEEKE